MGGVPNKRHYPRARLARLCCTSLTAGACAWPLASDFFAAAQAQTVLPTAGRVVSGQATIGTPSGNSMTINQNSSRAIIDWNSFSVGQNASVNFVQPNASSAILNRVTGSTSSSIAGQVTGNGQVFLINPNGIAITPTGTVQVGGGFVASTLDITNSNFNDGNLSFAGNGASAGVSNAGAITSASGGFVGLIGGAVSNSGTIDVPLGKVGLGSGEQATINPTGDGFLQVAIPTGATAADGRALIDVAGNIRAKGGTIAITAATAQQAVRDAVNVSGKLSARSVSGSNGNILLDGGAGGNVTVSGALSATGGKRRKGGVIAVTGNAVDLTSTAKLNASGTDGGNILVGGDMRGGADPSAKLVPGFVRNAQTAIIQSGAFIKADGKTGSGGNVVVWSDNLTDFRGNISATGSGNGNGGLAEVSSHGVLNYRGHSDLSAANGNFGTLLLDPYNVTISNSSDSNISGGSPFTPNGDDSNLSVNTLQNALNSANVTVNTGSGGSQAGDITLADSIYWFSGTSLTLTAARDVIISGSVSTFGNAGLNLNGGRNVIVNSNLSGIFFGSLAVSMTAATGSVAINGASIDASGRNLTISAPSSGGDGVLLSSASLNVGGGTGTITGAATGSGRGLSFDGANTLSSSGGGSWTLDGSSDTGSGVFLAGAAAINSSGSTSITGSSNSGSSIYLFGSNTVSTSSGNLSMTGTASSYRGVDFLGSNYFYNNGSGSFNVSGASTSTDINNGGVALNAGSSLSISGNVSISGTSAANTPGIGIDSTTIAVTSGNLSLAGTSNSGAGLSFYSVNALNNSGSGTISVAGTSSSGFGIQFFPNATVSSYGNLTMQGTSPTSDQNGAGFHFGGGNSFTANSGNVSITGTDNGNSGSSAFSGSGLKFNGLTSITKSGLGTFALTGNSNTGNGVQFDVGAGLTTAGNVSVAGSSSGFLGVYLTGQNTLTATSGNLAISGTSPSNSGIFFSGASSVYTNGGSGLLSFNGTSSSYRGIDFYDSASMTFAGGVSVSGSATSGIGTNFQRNAIAVSSGNLTINGTSSSGSGVGFGTPATTSIANNGSGAVTVAGISNSGYGTLVSSGNNVTVSGNTTLSGSSTSNNGFYLAANGALTSSSGNLTVSGSSSSSVGLELRGTSSITNSGSGRLTLNALGGANLNSTINSTGGPLVISGSGNINQSGGTIAANNLLLSGASGNFNIDTASNQIGTVAGSAASIFFLDNTSLTTGTVQGTSGVTTTGNLSLITAGDLTIASGATISGANPILAATGAFINNAGSNAVTATTGRWLIYSNTPGGNTFGGLNSGNTAIWNATYASMPPGSVTATGKRYLFGYQPTLTFTSTNASKTYGDDATSAVATSYAVSGIEPGVANAYLADTASAVFSGTPAVTSAGAAPPASVAGSPYAINVAAGSVASLANYALAYVSSGQLTINPAPIDVTALGGSSNYGTSPPNPGLSASGLKNGETASVLTGLRNSFGITSTTDVGRYGTDVTGSLTNANYTVATTTSGSWDVIPLRGSLNNTPNPGSPVTLPSGINGNTSNKNTSALDSLANSSGAVNAENRAAVNSSARSSPQSAAGGAPFPGTFGNSVLPDMAAAPVTMPSVVAAANASMASAPKGCGDGSAGVSVSGAGDGQSGGCQAASAPPQKEQGIIDFALSKLNRNALFESIDREFSDIQSSKDAVPAALTQVIAGTSVAVTAGVIGWLLRGGALLTALLSSMPLWREFDPLTVVMRPKRRDEEEDQPPSEVDLMFDGARKLKYAMRGHAS